MKECKVLHNSFSLILFIYHFIRSKVLRAYPATHKQLTKLKRWALLDERVINYYLVFFSPIYLMNVFFCPNRIVGFLDKPSKHWKPC